MIYALPEIRSDALRRTYVSDVLGHGLKVVRVLHAKQSPIDAVKPGRPMVKVLRRVT